MKTENTGFPPDGVSAGKQNSDGISDMPGGYDR